MANDDLRFSLEIKYLEDSKEPLDGIRSVLRGTLFFGLAYDFLFRAGFEFFYIVFLIFVQVD